MEPSWCLIVGICERVVGGSRQGLGFGQNSFAGASLSRLSPSTDAASREPQGDTLHCESWAEVPMYITGLKITYTILGLPYYN